MVCLMCLICVVFAVVYPGIDILGNDGQITPAANAVGAFDWGLNFRWEVRS